MHLVIPDIVVLVTADDVPPEVIEEGSLNPGWEPSTGPQEEW